MIKRILDIVIIGGCFSGIAYGLHVVGFWKRAGLAEPHGYVVMGFLFLGMFFLLTEFLFHPYLEVMEEREAQTTGKRKQVEKTRAEADAMIAQYQSRMEEASLRAIRDREQVALAAEEEERKRLTSAKEFANESFSAALKNVERDRDSARRNLKGSVDPLALEIVERVLNQRNTRPPLRVVAGAQET